MTIQNPHVILLSAGIMFAGLALLIHALRGVK